MVSRKIKKVVGIIGLVAAAIMAGLVVFGPSTGTMRALCSQEQAASYNQDCIFCKIIARQEPGIILYEDDLVIAIEKRQARVPVDCLIIPKKHIVNVKDLDLDGPCDIKTLTHIFKVAQILSKRLAGSQDFKLLINNGEQAGQTVFHMHVHFKSHEVWA